MDTTQSRPLTHDMELYRKKYYQEHKEEYFNEILTWNEKRDVYYGTTIMERYNGDEPRFGLYFYLDNYEIVNYSDSNSD